MSWYPKNVYPEGSGVDSKTIEDVVTEHIINNDMSSESRYELAEDLIILYAVHAAQQEAQELSTSYEYYEDGEEDERINEEIDEEVGGVEEGGVQEEEEEEESYDEDEESEEDDDIYDEFDDVTTWGSLRFLVNDMPAENEEPEPITRKRALTREEMPCPPTKNPAKRQKTDTSAVSKTIAAQPSETKDLVMASSSARPEWLREGRREPRKSEIPRKVRSVLLGTPLTSLHIEAQSFLMGMDFDRPYARDLSMAVVDMGLRFSKTATRKEYSIVLNQMSERPVQAVMYNAAHNNFMHQHMLFWNKVNKATGKPNPPEKLVERREARQKLHAELWARSKARLAEQNAKKLATQKKLKEQFAKKISEGEAKKLPLDERVHKWLREIIPVQKK
ncbi:hypothetical protein FBEOM_6640 [Fusarium beomiforme]|uniref:Uncharacterized protein n=1 Tax=Fusarium beomiforme TaxID=44412 RepID=A0A9P5DVX7_9HYPO|nr:hypothetical protein FBEOM_6640 [Fusarium beomiforme]